MKPAKPTRKAKPEFPKEITVPGIHGISAKIYRTVQKKKDKDGQEQDYVSFVLAYSLLGKRRLEAFADLGEAEGAAEAAVKRIANGEQLVLELTNSDRMVYLRSIDTLKELSDPPALDKVCRTHVDALKALRGLGSIIDACTEYAKRHGSIASRILVPDAVKEMIEQEEKQQDGKRKRAWVKLLKTHLKTKFAEDFNQQVHTVEPAHINAWLAKLDCAERTKKNIRDTVKHFFKWCRGRGYIAKDADPMADVMDFRKRKRGKIHILTPEELGKLLATADDEMVPYLALRAFAGLRDAEATAIDWSHIDLNGGWITITEEVAKLTDDDDGTRRLIPVRPCLKSWLKDYVKPSGKVYPHAYSSKQIAELCENAKVSWKRNCLRHSYISYAVAESNDIPAVAIHSGNSPAIIRKHYLQVVKPDAAKEWFNIVPVEAVPAGKIEQMPKAAVG